MLINQGSYGCIYYDGKTVSKIVNTDVATREIEMSRLIRKIPNYQDYFVPILSSCTVQAKNVRACSSLYHESHYVLLELPYIPSVPVRFGKAQYDALLPALAILRKAKIVHFDLTEQNILFTPEPRIIDFGISLTMNKMNLPAFFYIYDPRRYIWPIEVHLLCFLMRYSILTTSVLSKVCTEVYKHSPVLNNVEECISYYSFVVTYSRPYVLRRLLHGWKTWDRYALSILLMQYEPFPPGNKFHPNPKLRL